MFVLIVKIIFFGSLAGMAVMALKKIPALRTLPVGRASSVKKKQSSLDDLLKITKEIAKILGLSFKNFIEESFSYFRNVSKERSKEKEKPKLSDDYWEKVRKG